MALGQAVVKLSPMELVRPEWINRAAYFPLPPDVVSNLQWNPEHKIFLAVASDALSGKCRQFAGRRPFLAVPYNVVLAGARAYNKTELFESHHVSHFHYVLNAALVAMTDMAMVVRVWCATLTALCAEVLGNWGAAWCLFRRRLQRAATKLPKAAFVASALNLTASQVLSDVLPREAMVPLVGLASGALSVEVGLMSVENCSGVFAEFVEYALILGGERRAGGRVAHAVFHGDAGDRGIKTGRLFRGDILLWALDGGDGGRPSRPRPSVAEVGVDRGDCSKRLLEGHPSLQWLGVDIWGGIGGAVPQGADEAAADAEWDRRLSAGAALLHEARGKVRPWLGTDRARLLLASSTEATALLQKASFDLVFLDADHTEEAVLADVAAWSPYVRPGGILAGHDYSRMFPGVAKAANAALPPGATLHLAPDQVYWWRVPGEDMRQL